MTSFYSCSLIDCITLLSTLPGRKSLQQYRIYGIIKICNKIEDRLIRNSTFCMPLHQKYTDILIIYFMSLAASKLNEHSSSRDTDEQMPSTPRKKPKYSDQNGTSRRKVKSITKLVENESTNCIYSMLVLFWLCFICGAMLMSFQAKKQEIASNAIREIERCAVDYQKNRCDTPVKGVMVFCNQKLACMNEDPKELAQRRISYTGILGEMAQEFMNGTGVVGIVVGVVLIWLSMRQKGLNRVITSVEYYQNP